LLPTQPADVFVERPPVQKARERVLHRENCQSVTKLQVGDGESKILRDQLDVNARGDQIQATIATFEVSHADGIAMSGKRHAETAIIDLLVKVLAGNIATIGLAEVRTAAPQSPTVN